MITILVDPVEHVVTMSKYSKELNLLCVCFVTFICFFIRRPTPAPLEFFRGTWLKQYPVGQTSAMEKL